MKYLPDAVVSGDLGVATKTALGGEKKLYISRVPAVRRGELALAGDGSGIYTADPVYGTLPATGVDLVVKVDGELKAATAAVITVVGVAVDNSLLSGTATFAPPSWVRNRTNDFPESFALDITPNQTGKKFKTITSVTITNALKGSKASLFSMPDTNDWVYIDKVESVDWQIGISPGVAIPDGLDGASEVKRGRSQPSSLSISALHRSVADGLARFGNATVCVRMDVEKEGKLVVERMVAGNCIMEATANFPDGSEIAKQAGAGMFEDAFAFSAP